MGKKRILIAPLNWGLGHATRCIPIIKSLLKHECEVVIASDGEAKALLTDEFPDLECLDLPSYRVQYKSGSMVRNMAKQMPRLIWTVGSEHKMVQELIKKHRIDGIISDNRYGCFSKAVPSVLITHQLKVIVLGALASKIANWLIGSAIAKFPEVWVPDYASETENLTGLLSHQKIMTPEVHFIGPLTRMRAYHKEREYDVAVVLSGPEPQRSNLESALLAEALTMPMDFIFVQGKPNTNKQYFAADHVEVVSYLSSQALNDVINASRVVVCRSGYSSIMDLVALRKKALLIPTPGQTEQEYLAEYLEAQTIFPFQNQDAIHLADGIKSLSKYEGFQKEQFPLDIYENRLLDWVAAL